MQQLEVSGAVRPIY